MRAFQKNYNEFSNKLPSRFLGYFRELYHQMSMINFKNHACKTGLSTNILVFSGILRSLRSFSEAFRKYYDTYTAGWGYSRNICMVLFCHTLCFPRYFLETKLSSTPEKNPIWRFLARKNVFNIIKSAKAAIFQNGGCW